VEGQRNGQRKRRKRAKGVKVPTIRKSDPNIVGGREDYGDLRTRDGEGMEKKGASVSFLIPAMEEKEHEL